MGKDASVPSPPLPSLARRRSGREGRGRGTLATAGRARGPSCRRLARARRGYDRPARPLPPSSFLVPPHRASDPSRAIASLIPPLPLSLSRSRCDPTPASATRSVPPPPPSFPPSSRARTHAPQTQRAMPSQPASQPASQASPLSTLTTDAPLLPLAAVVLVVVVVCCAQYFENLTGEEVPGRHRWVDFARVRLPPLPSPPPHPAPWSAFGRPVPSRSVPPRSQTDDEDDDPLERARPRRNPFSPSPRFWR